MTEQLFDKPRRQELLGVVIMFFDNVRRIVRIFFALIAIAIFKSDTVLYLKFAAAASVLLIAIYSWLQYRRFTFQVEEDELIIKRGVFTRERLSIPFDRIQTVNLHQNIIQQALKLTGVKIDTAGSGREELQVKALKFDDAIALQNVLQDKIKQKANPLTIATEDQNPESNFTSTNWITLVTLNFKQLLLVGLTQNHIRSGLLAFAVFWGWMSQFESLFKDFLENAESKIDEQVIESISSSILYGTLFLIISFLIIAVATSVIRTILRFFNFKASLNDDAFEVQSGLFNRNTDTIPIKKIQFIEWKDNFLMRIARFKSVKLFQGRSNENARKRVIEIPACYNDHEKKVNDFLFEASLEKDNFSEVKIHSFYKIRLTIIFIIIGLFSFGSAIIYSFNWGAVILLITYLISVIFLVNKYVNSIRIYTSEDTLIFQRGWLFQTKSILKTFKIQGVKKTQSIFQKRRNAGNLVFYTAGGHRTIPYIHEEQLVELYDKFLYQAQTNPNSWM